MCFRTLLENPETCHLEMHLQKPHLTESGWHSSSYSHCMQLGRLHINLRSHCSYLSSRPIWRLSPAHHAILFVSRIKLQTNAIYDDGASQSDDIGSSNFPTASEIVESSGLPLPALYQQKRPDHFKEIKALRTYSNNLAREDRLQRIICGSSGITANFIIACADILCKAATDKETGNYLRIKLGEGAGVERKEAAKALELLLDAVCVYEVGYTITLYREAGLPRPSNTIRATSKDTAIEEKPATSPRVRVTASMRSEAAKKELKSQPKPPPEFQVTSP